MESVVVHGLLRGACRQATVTVAAAIGFFFVVAFIVIVQRILSVVVAVLC